MHFLIATGIIFFLCNDHCFNGVIELQHYREDTPEMREAYSFLNTDVPYDSILISNEELTICGDTLISIHSDMNRRPYSTYIQYRDSVFMKLKNGIYKRIRIEPGISLIDNYHDEKRYEKFLGLQTKGFSSITREGTTEYQFDILTDLKFPCQTEHKYLFSRVFSNKGIIMNTKEKYLLTNVTKTTVVKSISIDIQNCKEKIEELDFIRPE